MARVFVSHAGADAALAGELHRWLVDDGHEVFLDQDLHDGIAIGEQWQARLHERLRWADATVCLLTSAYVGSTWCSAEVGVAQSRGSRLVPVRAEPGVHHPLLASVQALDLARDDARTRLSETLRQVDAVGGSGWPDDRAPFPGLRAFDTDMHRAFFGRTRDVERLTTLLRSPAERAEAALLLVVGPSGCGKSSLVRAGLLPAMSAEDGWAVLPAILPAPRPTDVLIRELAAYAGRLGTGWSTADVRHRLDDGGLAELANDLLLAGPGPRRTRLLLVVDQFEELLTQVAPVDRARFAAVLGPALTGPVQVVATLRPEFLDPLLASPELAGLPKRVHTLEPLRREALREVIEGPTRLAGIGVDEELVARLVDDTDSGDALPLLAYALGQLAEGVGRGGRLLASRYEQIGGVRGALALQADAALLEAMAVSGQDRDRVVRELLRLVTVDEHGHPTRWRVRRDELPETVTTQLDAFVARRLLTTDLENDHAVVEVAHEAFLSGWPPLHAAIAAASTALRARRQIEGAADEWTAHGQPTDQLWERGQLAAALNATGAHVRRARPVATAPGTGRRTLVADRVELSASAQRFLLASARRDRRRRGRSTAILSALLVLALIGAGVAVVQQRAAVAGQRLATARELLAQAAALRGSDPRTALRLDEAADAVHPDADTRAELVSAALGLHYTGLLEGHTDAVYTVAFAPTGHLLATASRDKTALLWDVTDPPHARRVGVPLTGHTDAVVAVAFSPDGRTLATASLDKTVLLWDVTDPAHPRRLGDPLTGHTDGVEAAAFSPDGRTLASTSRDRTVLLWDVTDPAHPRRLGDPLTGHTGAVRALAFAPHLLAAAAEDGTVLLWDTTDPAHPRRLGDQVDVGVNGGLAVAFSADGHLLATGGADNAVLLWDMTDPAHPHRVGDPLTGHTNLVLGLAFSPKGPLVLAAGADKTVLAWDLTDPTRPRRTIGDLVGHTGSVTGVAVSPDGTTFASASDDETVLLWGTVDPDRPVFSDQVSDVPRMANTAATAVAFTPDGHAVASANDDRTISQWDLTDPTGLLDRSDVPTHQTGAVYTVALAPDGHTLVTGGADRIVRLWDTADPDHPHVADLAGHTDAVYALAFSPDGHILATAGVDRTVLLWDLADRTRPRRLGAPLTNDTGAVTAVTFSPDGRVLATAGDDPPAVKLWDATDPAHLRRIGPAYAGHTSSVLAMAFSPDGHTLATAGLDRTGLLWDVTDPTHVRRLDETLAGHTGAVRAVAFSPDGHTLATAGFDRTVLLWDVTDPNQPRRLGDPLLGHSGAVYAAAFARDGRSLATADSGGSVLVWDLTGLDAVRAQPMGRACRLTHHGPTPDQWARYVPDLPYQDPCAPSPATDH